MVSGGRLSNVTVSLPISTRISFGSDTETSSNWTSLPSVVFVATIFIFRKVKCVSVWQANLVQNRTNVTYLELSKYPKIRLHGSNWHEIGPCRHAQAFGLGRCPFSTRPEVSPYCNPQT